MTEFEDLRRAGDKEISRRSLDVPQARNRARVAENCSGPEGVVDEVVGHGVESS